MGESPPPWMESHPVKSEWRECCSWRSSAFVPLTTVVFALGPFQQDGVGIRVTNDPEAGGEWRTEWKTTLCPDIHPNSSTAQAEGLKNSTGRKPAYVHITEQCEFILTVEFSIFRLFLHRGKHLQVIHALSQGADLFFLQKSTHLGVDML